MSSRAGSSIDDAHDMDVDAAGSVYLTGNFSFSVDFDPGPGQYVLTSSKSQGGNFVLKLDDRTLPSGFRAKRDAIHVSIACTVLGAADDSTCGSPDVISTRGRPATRAKPRSRSASRPGPGRPGRC